MSHAFVPQARDAAELLPLPPPRRGEENERPIRSGAGNRYTQAMKNNHLNLTSGGNLDDPGLLTHQFGPLLLQPARETEESLNVGQHLRFDDDGCPNEWLALPLA